LGQAVLLCTPGARLVSHVHTETPVSEEQFNSANEP